jgi:hypothetical protein
MLLEVLLLVGEENFTAICSALMISGIRAAASVLGTQGQAESCPRRNDGYSIFKNINIRNYQTFKASKHHAITQNFLAYERCTL